MTSQQSAASTVVDDDDDDDDNNDGNIVIKPRLTFAHLPPEIRHKIWRMAAFSANMNFFNVHSYPHNHQDHTRCCYLDLRRLSITDTDEDVAAYDPSAWQTRYAIRATCREARTVCALPRSRSALITLTRPRGGLFVRAGEDPIPPRRPCYPINVPARFVDRQVYRHIEVDRKDFLILSLENCSFSLHEDEGNLTPESTGGRACPHLRRLPHAISPSRICVSMTEASAVWVQEIRYDLFHLMYTHIDEYTANVESMLAWKGPLLVLLDGTLKKKKDKVTVPKFTKGYRFEGRRVPKKLWDRFGNCYTWIKSNQKPAHDDPGRDTVEVYHLVKVPPVVDSVHEKYAESAWLHRSDRMIS